MTKTEAVKWVEHSTGLELNDNQQRCIAVLAEWAQVYNIHPIEGWEFGPEHLRIVVRNQISTWDSDGLTRLVLAAHRHYVRLEVAATLNDEDKTYRRLKEEYGEEVDHWYHIDRQAYLEILLHPRQSTGGMMQRHPGLDYLRDLTRRPYSG